MSRHPRRMTAQETVAIMERGDYPAPSGRTVPIAESLARAVQGTVLYRPDELDGLLERLPAAGPGTDTRIEVTGETTLAAARRLCAPGEVANGHGRLVLGAWGCGVFGNDPAEVAEVFAGQLRPGGLFAGRFEHVVFAVWDTAKGAPGHAAFQTAFA